MQAHSYTKLHIHSYKYNIYIYDICIYIYTINIKHEKIQFISNQ